MISLLLSIPPEEYEQVSAALAEAGTLGIVEENPTRLRAFFGQEPELEAGLAQWVEEVREEPEQDWAAEVEKAWEPFTVGERFFLVPDWREDPAPDGRLRLAIHPGMACGTGRGPATQLALIAMERFVARGAAVLDVGTGSGILAEAARLLGARLVAACDIDHEAAAIARGHVAKSIAVFTGSVRSLRPELFDTVVANLNAATLIANAVELGLVCRRGGVLILSGFEVEDADGVTARFGGLPRASLASGTWRCLVL